VPNFSQGSVATRSRCGGIFNNDLIVRNFEKLGQLVAKLPAAVYSDIFLIDAHTRPCFHATPCRHRLFAGTKLLINKFAKCSHLVKKLSFKNYCLCVYDLALWRNCPVSVFDEFKSRI